MVIGLLTHIFHPNRHQCLRTSERLEEIKRTQNRRKAPREILLDVLCKENSEEATQLHNRRIVLSDTGLG